MIAMLLLAALQSAPQVDQPPHIRNPTAVFTFEDYPQASLRNREYGIVSFLLHVSTDGKVVGCDVTESSGFRLLDTRTCDLMKARAQFDPALDFDGKPVAGEYRSVASWGVDRHRPLSTMDIDLKAPSLPLDYESPAKLRVILDATGHVASCEVTTTSGSEIIDRSACAYVSAKARIEPPKSRSPGVAAAAVRTVTVTVSAEAPH